MICCYNTADPSSYMLTKTLLFHHKKKPWSCLALLWRKLLLMSSLCLFTIRQRKKCSWNSCSSFLQILSREQTKDISTSLIGRKWYTWYNTDLFNPLLYFYLTKVCETYNHCVSLQNSCKNRWTKVHILRYL